MNVKCECNENVSVGTCEVKKSWESICSDEIRSNSVREWSKEVNRISAKSGVGLNKLRTYALYKQTWGCEPYLDLIHNRAKRVLLTKFRIGICPLRIETGRYEVMNRIKGIEANLRYCLVCYTERVEDEYHFLMVCPI